MEENKKGTGFFDGNPKMLFAFGLVSGIALMAIFGGGISLPSFEGGNSDVVRTFDNPSDNEEGGNATTLAAVTENDRVLGDVEKAKVVLVEYSDFECPYCGAHQATLKQALDEYGDDIALVYRHFPLSFHPEAIPSALAAECAGDQDEFWAFHDVMYENQTLLGEDFYTSTAEDLDLDMDEFNDCYESQKYAAKVSGDQKSGLEAGVEGTPAVYVNGVLVTGAVPYSTLQDAIETVLAE